MTSFTDTWNAGFDAVPADAESMSLGAGRIRTLKLAIKERLAVDHKLDGDANDGAHTQCTLLVGVNSQPPTGYARLRIIDAIGTLSVMGDDGTEYLYTPSAPPFVAGTRIVFSQAAAPTGWTQDVSDSANNRMLRVVNSAGSGVGGAYDPTVMNVVPAHTHNVTGATDGQGSHQHGIPIASGSSGGGSRTGNQLPTGYNGFTDVSGYHAHNVSGTALSNGGPNWTPRYNNCIICQKN